MVFEISPGEYLRVSVNWTNIGQEAHAFDIVVYYGKYNSNTGEFEAYDAAATENVSSVPDQTQTTDCDFQYPIPQDLAGQKLDVLALIADLETETVYDALLELEAIQVTSS